MDDIKSYTNLKIIREEYDLLDIDLRSSLSTFSKKNVNSKTHAAGCIVYVSTYVCKEVGMEVSS